MMPTMDGSYKTDNGQPDELTNGIAEMRAAMTAIMDEEQKRWCDSQQ